MKTNPMLRIRQAVLVARDFDAAVEALRAKLPLADPFHDPEVAQFGVRNGVMALGDTFVEVISPVKDGTAAGRHLERIGGDGGYMVMFQLDDIAAARARIRMEQPASWRWAGPVWIAKAPAQIGPGRVTGATLTAREPTKLARTWAADRHRHRRPDRAGGQRGSQARPSGSANSK